MCPEDDSQLGRAGHTPFLALSTVLELPASFAVTAVVSPLSAGVWGRLPAVGWPLPSRSGPAMPDLAPTRAGRARLAAVPQAVTPAGGYWRGAALLLR